MRSWGAVLAVLAGTAVAAFVLKALPPVIFILLVIVAASYGWYRFRKTTKVSPIRVEADSLGLEHAPADRFGLLGFPRVEDLLFGAWRTLDVKLFDLRYTTSGQERRFSCALTSIDIEAPAIVLEPRTFFTPPEERGGLAELGADPDGLGQALLMLGADPVFREALLDDRMRAWLSGEGSSWGIELSGRWVLLYAPLAGARDTLGTLQTLTGFVDRIPQAVRERYAPAV